MSDITRQPTGRPRSSPPRGMSSSPILVRYFLWMRLVIGSRRSAATVMPTLASPSLVMPERGTGNTPFSITSRHRKAHSVLGDAHSRRIAVIGPQEDGFFKIINCFRAERQSVFGLRCLQVYSTALAPMTYHIRLLQYPRDSPYRSCYFSSCILLRIYT